MIKNKLPNKKTLYIAISEYGYNHPEGFTYAEIKEGLELSNGGWEDKILIKHMTNALESGDKNYYPEPNSFNEELVVTPAIDSMFFVINKESLKGNSYDLSDGHKFILKYDAYFNYIDYLEYKEAIRSSKIALRIAIISIIITLVSILFQIFGSISLDENQFENIIKTIEKRPSIPWQSHVI